MSGRRYFGAFVGDVCHRSAVARGVRTRMYVHSVPCTRPGGAGGGGLGVCVSLRVLCAMTLCCLYVFYLFHVFSFRWSVALSVWCLFRTLSLCKSCPRYLVRSVMLDGLYLLPVVVPIGAELLPSRRHREPEEAHRRKVLRRDAALVQRVRREHRGACCIVLVE